METAVKSRNFVVGVPCPLCRRSLGRLSFDPARPAYIEVAGPLFGHIISESRFDGHHDAGATRFPVPPGDDTVILVNGVPIDPPGAGGSRYLRYRWRFQCGRRTRQGPCPFDRSYREETLVAMITAAAGAGIHRVRLDP
jgi:hypothetical protein